MDFESQSNSNGTSVTEKVVTVRFPESASKFWYVHTQVTEWNRKLVKDAARLFALSSQRWTLWSRMFKVEDVLDGKDRVIPSPDSTLRDAHPLFYMSLLGFTDQIQCHLDGGAVAYVKDTPNTCLNAASAAGCLGATKLLVTLQVDLDAKDGNGRSPLHSSMDSSKSGTLPHFTEHFASYASRGRMDIITSSSSGNLAREEIHARNTKRCHRDLPPTHGASTSQSSNGLVLPNYIVFHPTDPGYVIFAYDIDIRLVDTAAKVFSVSTRACGFLTKVPLHAL
jgi:hypothetical protein